MKKSLVVLLISILAVVVSCNGDDSPSTPTPVATTPTPTPTTTVPLADAQLELTGTYECIDRWCDWADFELAVENSGGVGANINYCRTKNRNGQTVHEIGADHFLANLGTNRVEAGETLDFLLRAQLTYVVVIGYGDDHGVKGEVEWYPDLPR